MKDYQLARELGVTVEEAAVALENDPEARFARRSIELNVEHRMRKYEQSILPVWAQYSAGDSTDFDGTIKLVQELGFDLEDPHVLALVYELQAPEVGVFSRDKYVSGWARYGITQLPKMKTKAAEFGHRMDIDDEYFAHVYAYCFRYNLPEGSRLLPLETALAYWNLLLAPKFPLGQAWVAFMETSRHNVSYDTWSMALKFLEHAQKDPKLSDYDESSSWPIVIDDFVEHLQQQAN